MCKAIKGLNGLSIGGPRWASFNVAIRFCGVGEGRGSARDGGGVKTNYWFGGGFTG